MTVIILVIDAGLLLANLCQALLLQKRFNFFFFSSVLKRKVKFKPKGSYIIKKKKPLTIGSINV